jgi:hypothetical protein
LATVLTGVLVGVVTAIASAAAKPNNPTITFVSPPSPAEGATVNTNSVTFEFTYNRTTKQTQTLTCALQLGQTTISSGPCDDLVDITGGAQADTSYDNLANGDYTFTATLTLTDHGTTSATRQFTVSAPIGHLYWANLNGHTIGRADLDGNPASVNQSFINVGSTLSFPAVDSNFIYWASPFAIGRADLNGQNTNTSFITTGLVPFAVAVDASHIYWSHQDITGDTIGRADLDGNPASVNQNFITGVSHPVGLAVDGSHIYWANSSTGTIGRADLDGNPASVNQNFITGAATPNGVAVDGNHIYWSNQFTATIGRADLDGNPASVNQNFLNTGAILLNSMAVDGSHIYWTDGSTNTIGRADLDGNPASVNQNFITGAVGPDGVTVGP